MHLAASLEPELVVAANAAFPGTDIVA